MNASKARISRWRLSMFAADKKKRRLPRLREEKTRDLVEGFQLPREGSVSVCREEYVHSTFLPIVQLYTCKSRTGCAFGLCPVYEGE